MKFLLPHRFKTIGAVIAPIGIVVWLAWQLGYISVLRGNEMRSLRMGILFTCFFSFLFGLYFVAFSKEKTEDEMVQRIRLESFMFASWVQIVLVIAFFILFLALGEPLRDGGLLLTFVGLVTLFWLSFIVRFNYVLHFKHRQWTT
jgi:hypothetical protein